MWISLLVDPFFFIRGVSMEWLVWFIMKHAGFRRSQDTDIPPPQALPATEGPPLYSFQPNKQLLTQKEGSGVGVKLAACTKAQPRVGADSS